MSNREEVVFCTELANDSETGFAEYGLFMHEAEVLIYPLVNAVEEDNMTAEEACKTFEPYRKLAACLYDPEEMEEYENVFPDMDWFMDWAPGPGTAKFWREAYDLGVPGVIYSEGDHFDGGPYFEVHRKEALEELRQVLAGRYKLLVHDQSEYGTSMNSDPEETRKIIKQASTQPDEGSNGPSRGGK